MEKPAVFCHEQTCSHCLQYLSVPPVKITKTGNKICGRCVKHIPEKLLSTNSLYNQVANHCVFDCVNQYDGCGEKLTFQTAFEHESRCVFHPRTCPFCKFTGNWCQIVEHAKNIHSDNFVSKLTLQIRFNENKSFLVIVRSNIFLIHVRFDRQNKTLRFNISPVTGNNLATDQLALKFYLPRDPSNFKYFFVDFGLGTKNNSIDICLERLAGHFKWWKLMCCHIIMDLSETFIELKTRETNVQNLEAQLETRENAVKMQRNVFVDVMKKMYVTFFTCKTCKKISSRNVYFCPNYHCFCSSCVKNKCSECNSTTLTKITQDILRIVLDCDWSGCLEVTNFVDYMSHKRNCDYRPYECPLENCRVTVYSARNLSTHWHCLSPSLIREDTIACKKYDYYNYYWLLDNELYHVLIHFTEKHTDIIIRSVNVLPNNFIFNLKGYCSYYKVFYNLNLNQKHDIWQHVSDNLLPNNYPIKELLFSVEEKI